MPYAQGCVMPYAQGCVMPSEFKLSLLLICDKILIFFYTLGKPSIIRAHIGLAVVIRMQLWLYNNSNNSKLNFSDHSIIGS